MTPLEARVVAAEGRLEEQHAKIAQVAAARLSPIRWSIRALCVAELRGLELEKASLASAPRMGGLALVSSGDQVLERLGLEHESAARCARSLGALLAAQLVVGAGALALTRPRLAPVDEEDAR